MYSIHMCLRVGLLAWDKDKGGYIYSVEINFGVAGGTPPFAIGRWHNHLVDSVPLYGVLT